MMRVLLKYQGTFCQRKPPSSAGWLLFLSPLCGYCFIFCAQLLLAWVPSVLYVRQVQRKVLHAVNSLKHQTQGTERRRWSSCSGQPLVVLERQHTKSEQEVETKINPQPGTYGDTGKGQGQFRKQPVRKVRLSGKNKQLGWQQTSCLPHQKLEDNRISSKHWGNINLNLVLLLLLSHFSRVQLCVTPIDGSSPASPISGILQARTLEWVAISFSNAWKWKVKSLSRVQLPATPWTAAYQAPPSMGFSRQEYWSGGPLPSPQPSSRHSQMLI